MGPGVNRKLDVAEVDTALKRAAHRALNGTRAQRSGRFLPAKERSVASLSRASKRPSERRRNA